jgi:hypothetical protein
MQQWLSRLTYSFLIIAAVLAWQGYKLGQAGAAPQWQLALYCVGAAACAALGFAGLRARHRTED